LGFRRRRDRGWDGSSHVRHVVFESYGPDKSGKESKMLEIVYTKK
jgi:hypothetical protein